MSCVNPEEMARLRTLRRRRDELLDARLNGIRSARDSDGSEVQYRTDAEMAAAMAAVDAEIAAAIHPQPKTIYLRTSKGL